MFNPFKRSKKRPPFETLTAFAGKNQYFVRTAQWRVLDKTMISVVDPHQPRMLTMDPWPQTVFLEADGQRAVEEFIEYVAGKYSGAIPNQLDKTIIEELLKLVDYQIIQFVSQKRRPEERFDEPRK